MNTTIIREEMTISMIPEWILTLKTDAKAKEMEVGEYLESILATDGRRPYNAETLAALREAKEGKGSLVDTSSFEAFKKSLFDDEDD